MGERIGGASISTRGRARGGRARGLTGGRAPGAIGAEPARRSLVCRGPLRGLVLAAERSARALRRELGRLGNSRHEDVLSIEKDPETFSSRQAPRPHGEHLPMMISMDNPEHQRRRSLVNRGFTPRRIPPDTRPRAGDSAARSSTRSASVASAISCGTSPRRCPCSSSPTCSASARTCTTTSCDGPTICCVGRPSTPAPEIARAAFDAMLGFRECQFGSSPSDAASPATT